MNITYRPKNSREQMTANLDRLSTTGVYLHRNTMMVLLFTQYRIVRLEGP